MGRPKKEEKKDDVAVPSNTDILKAIEGLADVVGSLIKSIQTPVISRNLTTESHPQTIASAVSSVPSDYRMIVNTVLNSKFGIDIALTPDSPSFSFSILVPREYSNASSAHWETYKEDRRTKIIQTALGLSGVKEWANLVYENLSQEIKAKVVSDRIL